MMVFGDSVGENLKSKCLAETLWLWCGGVSHAVGNIVCIEAEDYGTFSMISSMDEVKSVYSTAANIA